MELLNLLPSLNNSELLFISERDNIPIYSRNSNSLLRASIRKAIFETHSLPSELKVNSLTPGDTLTRQIAIEAGINPNSLYNNINIIYSYLVEWNLPYEYMNLAEAISSFVYIIYERKFDVPPEFWYYSSEMVLFMTPNNFKLYSNYDESPDEYLARLAPSTPKSILNYQTLPDLLKVAKWYNNPIPYFETRRGLIDYLFNLNDNILVQIFSSTHSNDYPERRFLVQRAIQIYGLPEKLPYIDKVNLVLSRPAPWFEEKYLKNVLYRGKIFRAIYNDFEELLPDVLDDIHAIDEYGLNNLPTITEYLYESIFVVPNYSGDLLTILETKSKEFLKFSQIRLREITNLANDIITFDLLQDLLLENKFSIRTSCPIAYGKLFNFTCYSVDELILLLSNWTIESKNYLRDLLLTNILIQSYPNIHKLISLL